MDPSAKERYNDGTKIQEIKSLQAGKNSRRQKYQTQSYTADNKREHPNMRVTNNPAWRAEKGTR